MMTFWLSPYIYIVMFEGHIFQKDFIYFYLLKRQRSQERKRNNPPSMHPNAQNCQTRLKSEAQNSIHAFHLGDRSPSTESISKHLHQSRGKTPHRHSNMGSMWKCLKTLSHEVSPEFAIFNAVSQKEKNRMNRREECRPWEFLGH